MMHDENAAEIAQIEREIEILRTRCDLMQRSWRMASVFFAIALPMVGIAIAGLFVYALIADFVVGLYIIGVATVCGILVWIGRGTEPPPAARTRPSQFLPVGLSFNPVWTTPGWWWRRDDEKSEYETMQDMIALREKRLRELRAR